MSRHPTRILRATAAVLLSLLCGCVKKSEYDALQIENQTLQTRVDENNHLLVQSQADFSALQIQMRQYLAVQTQLQRTQQDFVQSQDEFAALKSRFDHFRSQHRTAMVGKRYSQLSLDDGKVLQQAEITAVSADELSIRHADGIAKVALARSSPDLRMEACYDPLEAGDKAREKAIAKTRGLEARPALQQVKPTPALAPPVPGRNAAEVLRAQLATQRQALNTEYQALAAKNSAAMRGTEWNASQPEASPLLNSLSGSRAVLGISRLQVQRSAILATLQQLRELDPAAR